MTKHLKIGDVFEVRLENDIKGYVQYIGNDTEELNSDVIRVFKNRYPIEYIPNLEEVLKDNIEFYSHVVNVKVGEKDSSWTKVGNSKDVGDLKSVLFRSPGDGPEKRDGIWYSSPKISKSWYVWIMNDKKKLVKNLVGANIEASIGSILPLIRVIERMNNGKYNFIYPDYK